MMLDIKAPTIIVEGPPGTGKTWSITTLIEAGLEVFVLFTEANGLDSLLDAMARKNLPLDRLHWHTVSPVPPGWAALERMATVVKNFSYEDIAKEKSGVGKEHQAQLMTLLKALQDFPDDRTGEHFGDVTSWDDNRVLVLDSAYGLNTILMDQTVGYKPTAHQGEWGVAMNLQEKLLLTLTSDCRCFLVLLAHVDKVFNEVSGSVLVSTSLLGQKNAPKIAKMFSEIVLARKIGDEYFWSTTDLSADLKRRALPAGDKLAPSFVPLVEAHKKRAAGAQQVEAKPPPLLTT